MGKVQGLGEAVSSIGSALRWTGSWPARSRRTLARLATGDMPPVALRVALAARLVGILKFMAVLIDVDLRFLSFSKILSNFNHFGNNLIRGWQFAKF